MRLPIFTLGVFTLINIGGSYSSMGYILTTVNVNGLCTILPLTVAFSSTGDNELMHNDYNCNGFGLVLDKCRHSG